MKLPDKVTEHFRNPQNVGEMEHPGGTAGIVNPICGDITELYLRMKDGAIEDAKFKSLGCAVTIASASVLTEKVKGQEISSLLSGSEEQVINHLVSPIQSEPGELPPLKLHCPPATVQAFPEAILACHEEQGETGVASRIRRLVALLARYYERTEKPEEGG